MFFALAALVGIATAIAANSITATRTSEIDFLITKTSVNILLPDILRQLYIVIIYLGYRFVNRIPKKFIIS